MKKLANYLHSFFYNNSSSDAIHSAQVLSIFTVITAVVLTIVFTIREQWEILTYLLYLYVICLSINILVVGIYYRYYDGRDSLRDLIPSFIVSMSIFGIMGANAGITLVFVYLIIHKMFAKLFTLGPMIIKSMKNLNINK